MMEVFVKVQDVINRAYNVTINCKKRFEWGENIGVDSRSGEFIRSRSVRWTRGGSRTTRPPYFASAPTELGV